MRRVVTVGALSAAGLLVARRRLPKMHERLMAHCEAPFEQMPDTFPPKKIMRGIAEIRADTRRILELLEQRGVEKEEGTAPSTARAVNDAA